MRIHCLANGTESSVALFRRSDVRQWIEKKVDGARRGGGAKSLYSRAC
jgi:hypothetical protein